MRDTPYVRRDSADLHEDREPEGGAARRELSRAERRRLQADLKARSRPAWRPRLLDFPVILVLAALVVLFGPSGGLGSSFFVSADGIPLLVSAGTTGAEVALIRGIAGRSGAKLDLAGDVRTIGGGRAGAVALVGSDPALDAPLCDGARIVAQDGSAKVEAVKKTSYEIPYTTVTEGEGSVVTLARQGEPGIAEALVGVGSRRTGATLVTKDPVNAVLRRTSSTGSTQKAVALTFDDGPGSATRDILAVLARKEVLATFFVLGGNASAQPSVIQDIREAGHEIENHTWSHPNLTKLSADQVRSELARTSEVLGGCSFFRPPGGVYNDAVTAIAGELGLACVLWDVDTRDWETKNKDAILAAVKQQVRPGAIILMHDGGGDRSATVAALPEIIDWLLDQGYAITTLGHLR